MPKYIIMMGLLLLVGSAIAEEADMGLYMASLNLDEEHSTVALQYSGYNYRTIIQFPNDDRLIQISCTEYPNPYTVEFAQLCDGFSGSVSLYKVDGKLVPLFSDSQSISVHYMIDGEWIDSTDNEFNANLDEDSTATLTGQNMVMCHFYNFDDSDRSIYQLLDSLHVTKAS
jgi:hypothetical protein